MVDQAAWFVTRDRAGRDRGLWLDHLADTPADPVSLTNQPHDEAMAWISLFPIDRSVLRRIVGAHRLVRAAAVLLAPVGHRPRRRTTRRYNVGTPRGST
jgi:hypothetical protein